MDQLTHSIYELTARKHFFRQAFQMLKFNGISGDYLEFGCASARTFRMAYSESRSHDYFCHMWAFDSFAGLPESNHPYDSHNKWVAGSMKESVGNFCFQLKLDNVDFSKVSIIEGFYSDTLSSLNDKCSNLNDVSLAYIDCDMYSSSVSVLNFLEPRLKHGMILAIDDYYCYSSNSISGERRAFIELSRRLTSFRFLPYIQYGWHGQSFIVENCLFMPDALLPGISH